MPVTTFSGAVALRFDIVDERGWRCVLAWRDASELWKPTKTAVSGACSKRLLRAIIGAAKRLRQPLRER